MGMKISGPLVIEMEIYPAGSMPAEPENKQEIGNLGAIP
jgi:hypothetical protein